MAGGGQGGLFNSRVPQTPQETSILAAHKPPVAEWPPCAISLDFDLRTAYYFAISLTRVETWKLERQSTALPDSQSITPTFNHFRLVIFDFWFITFVFLTLLVHT